MSLDQWDLRGTPRAQQREHAAVLKQFGRDGDFFIRDVESRPGCVGLAVVVAGKLQKLLIEPVGGGKCAITGGKKKFKSLWDLLQYYAKSQRKDLPFQLNLHPSMNAYPPHMPQMSYAHTQEMSSSEEDDDDETDSEDEDELIDRQAVVARTVVIEDDGTETVIDRSNRARKPKVSQETFESLPQGGEALQAHVHYLQSQVRAGKSRQEAIEAAVAHAERTGDYSSLEAILMQIEGNNNGQVAQFQNPKKSGRKQKNNKKSRPSIDYAEEANAQLTEHLQKLALSQQEMQNRMAELARQREDQEQLLRRLLADKTSNEIQRQQQEVQRQEEIRRLLEEQEKQRLQLEMQLESERKAREAEARKREQAEAKAKKEEEWRLQNLLKERQRLEEEAEIRRQQEERRRYERELKEKEEELRRQQEEARKLKEETERLRQEQEAERQRIEEEKQKAIEEKLKREEEARIEMQRQQEEAERKLREMQEEKLRLEQEAKEREEEAKRLREAKEREEELRKRQEKDKQMMEARIRHAEEMEKQRERERQKQVEMDTLREEKRKNELASHQQSQLKRAQQSVMEVNKGKRAALVSHTSFNPTSFSRMSSASSIGSQDSGQSGFSIPSSPVKKPRKIYSLEPQKEDDTFSLARQPKRSTSTPSTDACTFLGNCQCPKCRES